MEDFTSAGLIDGMPREKAQAVLLEAGACGGKGVRVGGGEGPQGGTEREAGALCATLVELAMGYYPRHLGTRTLPAGKAPK